MDFSGSDFQWQRWLGHLSAIEESLVPYYRLGTRGQELANLVWICIGSLCREAIEDLGENLFHLAGAECCPGSSRRSRWRPGVPGLSSLENQVRLQYSQIDRFLAIAYAFNKYTSRVPMPRAAIDDNKRMNLRLRPEQKATLMRAAALRHTDLTDFVLQPALREAKAVIEESERIVLSERDSLSVLNLLENPPAPNAKLRAAIAALPKPGRKPARKSV